MPNLWPTLAVGLFLGYTILMDTSKPITYTCIVAATDAELATLSTRHAKALHRSLSSGLAQECVASARGWRDAPDPDIDKAVTRLKALLDTRPHVPNKAEAKLARQAAAKRGK